QAPQPRLRVADIRIERVPEQRVSPGEALEAAGDPHAGRGEHAKVERPAAPPAVERQGGPRVSGTGRQLVRRPRPGQVPERVEPGPDVAAAVAADDALVAADREHDAAPRAGE